MEKFQNQPPVNAPKDPLDMSAKEIVQNNVEQLRSNPKENSGSGKKIFYGFISVLLGLSFLFYGLFLWSLLNGNLSNPLFDTIGLNPADLKAFMKTTTNLLFGGLALISLILFLVKVFQWIVTPKDDYEKPMVFKGRV